MPQQGPISPVLGQFTQLGFVVRDLEATLRHWIDILGVRPFLLLEEGSGADPAPTVYLDREVRVRTRLAFGFLGDVELEFIEPLDGTPSPYSAFIDAGREGLQHLGYWVDDHEGACRQLELAGYVAEYVIRRPNRPRPVVYYRSPSLIGPMIELVPPEWNASRDAVLACINTWKGGDPLIRYRTYGEFLQSAGVR